MVPSPFGMTNCIPPAGCSRENSMLTRICRPSEHTVITKKIPSIIGHLHVHCVGTGMAMIFWGVS